MSVIKIRAFDNNDYYINLNEISMFKYDQEKDMTFIEMCNNRSFYINKNVTGKLAKLITISTNGNILTLE